MNNPTVRRERYLRDALPIRLGGLAANLARVKSFSEYAAHRDVVEALLDESKYFIEWTAADAELSIQTALVDLQVQLAGWQHAWDGIWAEPARRRAVAEQAQGWSERILQLSGLMG